MRDNRYGKMKAARLREPANGKSAPDSVEVLKNFGLVIAPYSLILGTLYLAGFWVRFEVNIFQFVGVSDVVSSAVVPLIVMMVAAMAGLLTAQAHSKEIEYLVDKIPDSAIGWTMPKFLSTCRSLFILLYLILCAYLFASEWRWKWVALPLLISVPAAFKLPFEHNFIPWLPRDYQGIIAVGIIMCVPLSYGFGWQTANDIRAGRQFQYVVDSSVENVAVSSAGPEVATRYLGHVGEYDFFYKPVGASVVVAKIQDDNVLIVRSYRLPGTDPLADVAEKIDKYFGFR